MGDNGERPPVELEEGIREGEIAIAFGKEKQQGRILVIMAPGRHWSALEPHVAVQVGKDLIDKAVGLGMSVHIELPRAKVTQANHDMLVQRYKVILQKQLNQGKKTPADIAYLAERLVDISFNTVG